MMRFTRISRETRLLDHELYFLSGRLLCRIVRIRGWYLTGEISMTLNETISLHLALKIYVHIIFIEHILIELILIHYMYNETERRY